MAWIQDFDSTNLEIFIHVISRSHIIYHDIRNCKNIQKKDYFCSTKFQLNAAMFSRAVALWVLTKICVTSTGKFFKGLQAPALLSMSRSETSLRIPLPYYLVNTCPLNSDSYSMPLIRREIIIIINIYVHKALSLSFLCQLV